MQRENSIPPGKHSLREYKYQGDFPGRHLKYKTQSCEEVHAIIFAIFQNANALVGYKDNIETNFMPTLSENGLNVHLRGWGRGICIT